MINFDELSNSEIRIKLKELEDEYTVLQNKMKQDLDRLMLLNDTYNDGKAILNKRTKGMM